MIEQFLLSILFCLFCMIRKFQTAFEPFFLAIVSLDGAVRFRTRATFDKITPGTEVSLKVT